jgi:hypothetical protein
MSICPICNKNTLDPKGKEESLKLISEYERKGIFITGEHMNPGGRELWFENKKIQLFDCCYWCDYETLKSRLMEIKETKT